MTSRSRFSPTCSLLVRRLRVLDNGLSEASPKPGCSPAFGRFLALPRRSRGSPESERWMQAAKGSWTTTSGEPDGVTYAARPPSFLQRVIERFISIRRLASPSAMAQAARSALQVSSLMLKIPSHSSCR